MSLSKWIARAALGAAAALTLNALPGCADSACERNSDCAEGYCSASGECVVDCRTDRDCALDQVCEIARGQCIPRGGAGGQGGVAGTSGAGGSSTGGSGNAGGMSGGGPGGAGGTSGGTGGAPGGTGGTSGGTGGAPGGTGGTGAQGGMSGSSGTGGSTAGDLLEFDLCGVDTDCQGALVCREIYKNGPRRCTRTCTTSTQCMTGTRCELAGYCQISDIGRNCNVGDDCHHFCIQARNYCTSPCTNATDCPSGYGCMPVGGTRVCVATGIECVTSEANCVVNTGLCDSTLPVSSCTILCDTPADCPQRGTGAPPWSCISGFCRRPADVFGPLAGGDPTEYLCNGSNVVNACNDAFNLQVESFSAATPPNLSCPVSITQPGAAGDRCVDTCKYRGGCPFGYQCSALSSLTASSRTGLCLPALGAGNVGDACTTDSQCFHGYCNRTAGVCSRDCTDDNVCPKGFTCTATGQAPPVDGKPFKRCQ